MEQIAGHLPSSSMAQARQGDLEALAQEVTARSVLEDVCAERFGVPGQFAAPIALKALASYKIPWLEPPTCIYVKMQVPAP